LKIFRKNKNSSAFPYDYNSIRDIEARKYICHAPVRSMRFSQSGNILACCFNRGFILGKYPEQSIHDVWFGEKISDLRKYISGNDLSHGCGECARRISQKLYNLSGALQYDYLSQHQSGKYPSMFDFEISNTCNLECVMCIGENSSSIRRNREKLPPYTQFYDNLFVEQLIEFIPHLKEARFSGGEPFLIPIYYDIWEQIIKTNPATQISVLTNATILNDNIKDLLVKGDFRLSISIDSLQKETYEKIRINGNFETVTANLSYFYDYSRERNTVFSMNVCPMPSNYSEIPSIVLYCNQKNIQLILHTVVFPPAQSLWALGSVELKQVLKSLENEKFQNESSESPKNILSYQHFITQISTWIVNAELREKNKKDLMSKSENELLELLKTHLNQPSSDATSEINSILIEMGLSEINRKNCLINMLGFSPDLIVSELLHTDPEKLSIRLKIFNYESL
jgi:MoaA/NifB/PqqE/SkfB family radical SAM enzyme